MWGELKGWRSAGIELGIISVAVEIKTRVAYNLAEGEQVDGKESGTEGTQP